jgi:MoxR-like ATPase
MMKLSIGYPTPENEIILTRNFLEGKTADKIKSVVTKAEILEIKEQVRKVKIADSVLGYAGEIVGLTRKENRFVMGVSPRAMIMLVQASQANAFLSGRDFVTPDDIKEVAVNTLHHRVSLTYEAKIAGESIDKIIYSNVIKAKVPMV